MKVMSKREQAALRKREKIKIPKASPLYPACPLAALSRKVCTHLKTSTRKNQQTIYMMGRDNLHVWRSTARYAYGEHSDSFSHTSLAGFNFTSRRNSASSSLTSDLMLPQFIRRHSGSSQQACQPSQLTPATAFARRSRGVQLERKEQRMPHAPCRLRNVDESFGAGWNMFEGTSLTV